MKYFLIKETQQFIDPHGSSDNGGIRKFISSEPNWGNIESDQNFGSELDDMTLKRMTEEELIEFIEEESVSDEDMNGSEDGYNSNYYSYEVKTITEAKAKKYKEIIKEYEKI